MRTKGG